MKPEWALVVLTLVAAVFLVAGVVLFIITKV